MNGDWGMGLDGMLEGDGSVGVDNPRPTGAGPWVRNLATRSTNIGLGGRPSVPGVRRFLVPVK
jgi:hypothetical protein